MKMVVNAIEEEIQSPFGSSLLHAQIDIDMYVSCVTGIHRFSVENN